MLHVSYFHFPFISSWKYSSLTISFLLKILAKSFVIFLKLVWVDVKCMLFSGPSYQSSWKYSFLLEKLAKSFAILFFLLTVHNTHNVWELIRVITGQLGQDHFYKYWDSTLNTYWDILFRVFLHKELCRFQI